MRATRSFTISFLAVGPQRTATTWLHRILKDNPALCFPRYVKETMFFDEHFSKGLSWYQSHFKHRVESQKCGEIAPTYFDAPSVPKRIATLNPGCKLIITLRNPLDRALSLYRHHLRKGRIRGTFAEAISQMPRIVNSGHYATHIPRWFENFPEHQILIQTVDDIRSDPRSIMRALYAFLGVDEGPVPSVFKQIVNPATSPRFPSLARATSWAVNKLRSHRFHKTVEIGKMLGLHRVYGGKDGQMPVPTKKDREYLLRIYEEDIVYVEDLLDRGFPQWRAESKLSSAMASTT